MYKKDCREMYQNSCSGGFNMPGLCGSFPPFSLFTYPLVLYKVDKQLLLPYTSGDAI